MDATPFEPEWEGKVTLEISSATPIPARVYANEELCQILFFRSGEACRIGCADRKGEYGKRQWQGGRKNMWNSARGARSAAFRLRLS